MARVTLMPPFAGDFFGGRTAVEVDAGNLFRLIEALRLSQSAEIQVDVTEEAMEVLARGVRGRGEGRA